MALRVVETKEGVTEAHLIAWRMVKLSSNKTINIGLIRLIRKQVQNGQLDEAKKTFTSLRIRFDRRF